MLPVLLAGDVTDVVVAVFSSNRGVVGIIRNMPPTGMFPSLLSEGTERERCIGN